MVAWLLQQPRTVGQMSARMRRLILAARSDAGGDAPRRDARDRRVWVEAAGTDGLATLMARLPEPDALNVRAVLTALACDPTSPTDTRTREQRRADLLTTLVTGTPAAYGDPADTDLTVTTNPAGPGGPGGVGVQVTVTIPADTLRGGPTPAEVPGYGPLPATTARHLTGRATSGRGLIYHPDTGHLLGLTTLLHTTTSPGPGTGSASDAVPVRWLDGLPPANGYTHPPVMQRLAEARDTVCRAPGCTRAAHRCDCDHVVPNPDGPTTADNTCCLCRRHHRLKTHAPHWHTHIDKHGQLT